MNDAEFERVKREYKAVFASADTQRLAAFAIVEVPFILAELIILREKTSPSQPTGSDEVSR